MNCLHGLGDRIVLIPFKRNLDSERFLYLTAVQEWLRPVIGCYYMEQNVLQGTKPLLDSIRHFIRIPSGVFSVCHLCECRIVQ